jgi:hypothetical protein
VDVEEKVFAFSPRTLRKVKAFAEEWKELEGAGEKQQVGSSFSKLVLKGGDVETSYGIHRQCFRRLTNATQLSRAKKQHAVAAEVRASYPSSPGTTVFVSVQPFASVLPTSTDFFQNTTKTACKLSSKDSSKCRKKPARISRSCIPRNTDLPTSKDAQSAVSRTSTFTDAQSTRELLNQTFTSPLPKGSQENAVLIKGERKKGYLRYFLPQHMGSVPQTNRVSLL